MDQRVIWILLYCCTGAVFSPFKSNPVGFMALVWYFIQAKTWQSHRYSLNEVVSVPFGGSEKAIPIWLDLNQPCCRKWTRYDVYVGWEHLFCRCGLLRREAQTEGKEIAALGFGGNKYWIWITHAQKKNKNCTQFLAEKSFEKLAPESQSAHLTKICIYL